MTVAVAHEGPVAAPSTRPARRSWRKPMSWAATAVLLVLWFVLLRPVALGGPASFIGVDGTSMEPTLYEGDMVVLHDKSTYAIGEVVAYRIPEGEPGEGHNVVHRIIAGDGARGYTTQGDNNSYTDVWRPTDHDVIGAVWVELPDAARWAGHLRSPGPLAAAVGLGAFVVMALPDRRKRDRHGGQDQASVDRRSEPQVP